jgi:hypothetical protein
LFLCRSFSLKSKSFCFRSKSFSFSGESFRFFGKVFCFQLKVFVLQKKVPVSTQKFFVYIKKYLVFALVYVPKSAFCAANSHSGASLAKRNLCRKPEKFLTLAFIQFQTEFALAMLIFNSVQVYLPLVADPCSRPS